jgi:hypothetical protein
MRINREKQFPSNGCLIAALLLHLILLVEIPDDNAI